MHRAGRILFLALSTIVIAGRTLAAPSEDRVRLIPDIVSEIRGIPYTDKQVVSVGPQAQDALFNASDHGIAEGVGLDALLVYSNRIVFSTDVGFEKGGTVYADEDLVAFDANSGVFSLFFDGSAGGVPEAADLDACHLVETSGVLYLSFDVTVDLPGIGTVYDEDIVTFSGGFFTSVTRGQDIGFPQAADVDGFYLDSSNAYLSLDITASVGGHTGADEDVWVMDRVTSNVTLLSMIHVEDRADLAALDYPLDTDGDWLTDFEECSGLDEAASTYAGTDTPLDPGGYVTDARVTDTDGDGAEDGGEAAAGTAPTDPTDLFEIVGIVLPGTTNAVLRWTSVPGKGYAIWTTAAMEAGFTNKLVASIAAEAGTNVTAYTDGTGAAHERRFYCVEVNP